MPTKAQREALGDMWRTLDGIVDMARGAEEMRVSLYDSVQRMRVAPGEISEATCIALRQKAIALRNKYEECADEAEDVFESAKDLYA